MDLQELLRTLPNRLGDDGQNPGSARGYIGWGPGEDYLIVRGQGWNSPMVVDSWDALDAAHWDIDLNLVADFYFVVENDRLGLNVWLLHPRKGASRSLEIKSIQPEQLPEVKAFLRRSLEAHQRHFAWAVAP